MGRPSIGHLLLSQTLLIMLTRRMDPSARLPTFLSFSSLRLFALHLIALKKIRDGNNDTTQKCDTEGPNKLRTKTKGDVRKEAMGVIFPRIQPPSRKAKATNSKLSPTSNILSPIKNKTLSNQIENLKLQRRTTFTTSSGSILTDRKSIESKSALQRYHHRRAFAHKGKRTIPHK